MSLPTDAEIEALHHKYAPNDKVYELVYTHCQVVNEIAQWAAGQADEPVDTELLRAACLLHDIGTYVFFDPEGHIPNKRLYSLHAILGAKIVLDEGLNPRLPGLLETHILASVSKGETPDPDSGWFVVLPSRDYIPTTIEGELLCYADRFHSKKPVFNAYETFLARLQEAMPIQAQRFQAMAERFGQPDVEALAQKYGHPVK